MQEDTTAELGLLRGELSTQVTRILEVQDSMTLKISDIEGTVTNKTAEVVKSVSSMEQSIFGKLSVTVEESIAGLKEQYKSEWSYEQKYIN